MPPAVIPETNRLNRNFQLRNKQVFQRTQLKRFTDRSYQKGNQPRKFQPKYIGQNFKNYYHQPRFNQLIRPQNNIQNFHGQKKWNNYKNNFNNFQNYSRPMNNHFASQKPFQRRQRNYSYKTHRRINQKRFPVDNSHFFYKVDQPHVQKSTKG